MKIDKIKKLKNNKYKIIIDGEEIVTYDDVILKEGLLFKKTIDDELYKYIINETLYYDFYNSALKYALKKLRSTKEMKDYIDKMNLSNENKIEILNKLLDLKIVNDMMYTKAYINDKLLLSKDGLNKIRKDLIDNGIDIEIIDNELSRIDNTVFNDKLTKMIINKIRANHRYSNYKLKQKIINDMLSLGYNREDIIAIVEDNIDDDYDVLIKEYHKQYDKLVKKYEGSELEYKLRQSLYNKGFRYEDIKKEDLI